MADAGDRYVDLGGRTLHAVVPGVPEARALVLCESGLAAPVQMWDRVARHLASDPVVVVRYERAGTCASPPGPRPRTLAALAADAWALVDTLGTGLPVVLVGHSFGGLIATTAAARPSQRIAGLVLLDSLHPEELRCSSQQRRGMAWLEQSLQVAVVRSVLRRPPPDARGGGDGSPEWEAARRSLYRSPRTWLTALAELGSWKRADPRTLSPAPVPDVPVRVVRSADSLRHDTAHHRLQHALAASSPSGTEVHLPECSHDGLLLTDRGAAAVAQVIRSLPVLQTAGTPEEAS